MPRTAAVIGSNMVAIQVGIDEHTNRLVISVAIDNLVKGAAGQGIQNANLMCGFDETLGLTQLGLGT
jgi:N-acetyl-gamma-glutamyl-phosphate reductase